MKKILTTVALSLVVASLSAQVKWHTMAEAQELCKVRPKKIFVDVYTDWCGWCKVYDRNTFSDSSIAAYINKRYYAVKFNAEGNETVQLAGRTFVNPSGSARTTHQLAVALLGNQLSYPTVVFMDEDFRLLHVQNGYLTPPQLAPFLVYIGDAWYEEKKNTSFEAFSNSFVWPLKEGR